MKQLIILFSAFIIQTSAFAQIPTGRPAGGAGGSMNMGHFYGKVVDANKKGIDGVTVQLKGSKFDPATKKASEVTLATMITAANGDFSFDQLSIMGNFKLVITGVGYKKYEKQISFNLKPGGNPQDMMALVDKDLGNIKIEEDPNQLQSVTVTSTAKPQFEMGIDRKIFNVDKNLASTGQTAVEVMKNIPNFAMNFKLLRECQTMLRQHIIITYC